MLSRMSIGGAEGIAQQKWHVREEVRRRRASLSAAERERARDALTEQLIELVRDREAVSVSCYAPLPGEPDTSGFLAWAPEHGVEVLLPVSLPEQRLGWARLDGSPMREGKHGIAEPSGELLPASAASQLDLMLIPACAVDERGTRLGWGLGYFDRCLSELERRPPLFAVVHEADVVPALPGEPHDVPVDGVVTPEAIRRFPR